MCQALCAGDATGQSAAKAHQVLSIHSRAGSLNVPGWVGSRGTGRQVVRTHWSSARRARSTPPRFVSPRSLRPSRNTYPAPPDRSCSLSRGAQSQGSDHPGCGGGRRAGPGDRHRLPSIRVPRLASSLGAANTHELERHSGRDAGIQGREGNLATRQDCCKQSWRVSHHIASVTSKRKES